jgi:hypothetical protein
MSTPLPTSRVISSDVKVGCVDVLVGGERPAPGHVAVANRLPVVAEVTLERLRQLEVREPEPWGGIRGDDPRPGGGRKHEALADLDGAERLVPPA